MLFKVLLVLHTLGATIWTGGHLILTLTILPRALAARNPEPIRTFEEGFEKIGIPALLVQVVTGLWMAHLYLPGFEGLFGFGSTLSIYLSAKLVLLAATIALAIHARFVLIPRLDARTLPVLAAHIIAVTVVAVLFVLAGIGIRVGGIV